MIALSEACALPDRGIHRRFHKSAWIPDQQSVILFLITRDEIEATK